MIVAVFIIGALLSLGAGFAIGIGNAHPTDLPPLVMTTAIGAVVMIVAVLLHKGLIG